MSNCRLRKKREEIGQKKIFKERMIETFFQN